jgi:hypothetical protein
MSKIVVKKIQGILQVKLDISDVIVTIILVYKNHDITMTPHDVIRISSILLPYDSSNVIMTS